MAYYVDSRIRLIRRHYVRADLDRSKAETFWHPSTVPISAEFVDR